MPGFGASTPIPWLIAWNQTALQFHNMVEALKHPMFDYRPISLCMHGEQFDLPQPGPTTERFFSSIWVHRPGPAWKLFEHVPIENLENHLEQNKNKGFFPRLLGAIDHRMVPTTSFCIVYEEGAPESWVEPLIQGYVLTSTIDQRRLEGWYPRWAATYSFNSTFSGATTKHAFVWERQPDKGRCWWNGLTAPDPSNPPGTWHPVFGDQFVALTKGFWRPDLICPIQGGWDHVNNQWTQFGPRYFTIWRDEHLNNWDAQLIHPNQLLGKLQTLAPDRMPVRLQVSGKPGGTQLMTVIFAASDELIGRSMSSDVVWSGPTVPVPAPFQACDDWVREKMETYNIRGAQLAITYNGKLAHASAHTFAEFAYPPLTPTTLMAPCSVCKVFTALAAAHLWDQGALDPFKDSVGTLITSVPMSLWADPGFQSRKLIHLLSHTSNINNMTNMDYVALANYAGSSAPTDRDFVEYLLKHPSPPPGGLFTQPNPPNNNTYNPPPASPPVHVYSGLGFQLAGQCVAQKMGVSFVNALVETVFKPLGVEKRAKIVDITADQAWEDTTICRFHDYPLYWVDNYRLEPDPNNPGKYYAPHIAPWTYAGPGTTGAAAGGWAMAAVDVARIISTLDVPDNPLFSQEFIESVMLYRYGAGPWVGMGFFTGGYEPASDPYAQPIYAGHNGAWQGAAAVAARRNSGGVGICVVLMFNCLPYTLDWSDAYALFSHIDTYINAHGPPSWDLFHLVGLEEF